MTPIRDPIEATFRPLERDVRMSDQIADQILDSIITLGMRPGDRLSTERDLAEQFGVSRTVVREAVRSLAGRGVVDARPGRGLRVAAPRAATTRQSMTLFLRNQVSRDHRDVAEVRRMVEVEIAGLASVRATDDDLAVLRGICRLMEDRLDNLAAASEADIEFHRAIARATHNELYLMMLDAIADSLADIRALTFQEPGRPRTALEAHKAILARIQAHDLDGSVAAMRVHLDDVEQAWNRSILAQAETTESAPST